MKKVFFYFVVGAGILFNSLYAGEKINIVKNGKPRYEGTNFVSINLAYTISIGTANDKNFISDASWMDVDDLGNLYILDYYESKISVYDQKGIYIRSFGREGQGPLEMQDPQCFALADNKIFVLEKERGVKIFNINGDYIDFVLPSRKFGSIINFKVFNNCIYGLLLTLDSKEGEHGERVIREWDFVRYSLDLKNGKHIKKYVKKFNFFNLAPRMLINQIDSDQNIYLPDSDNKYLINKYDSKGKLLLSFSRDFRRIPYSDALKEWANRRWGSKIKPPKYPQIIRCIYFDDQELLWVLVGECYLDSDGDLKVESIIDIFNKKGEYLYSFTNNSFGSVTILKKGKLYVNPNVVGDNKLKVFDIIYSTKQN